MPRFPWQFILFCYLQRFMLEVCGVVLWPSCKGVKDCAKYKATQHQALPTLESRNVLANSFHGDAAYKLAKEHRV